MRVEFDDTIRVAPGNEAVSNVTSGSVLGGTPSVRGHELTLPLRAGLQDGDYSVRWSIVLDDGPSRRRRHRLRRRCREPVTAFGARRGRDADVERHRARPSSTSASSQAGVPRFGLLVSGLLGRRCASRSRTCCSSRSRSCSSAEAASSTPRRRAPRYALVMKIAVTIALAGGAAAALAPTVRALPPVAGAASLLLLLAPTSPDTHSTATSRGCCRRPPTSHTSAAAAVWLGGPSRSTSSRARRATSRNESRWHVGSRRWRSPRCSL